MKIPLLLSLVLGLFVGAAGAAEPRGTIPGATGPNATEPVATDASVPQVERLSAEELAGFRGRLLETLTRHLDSLLKADGSVAELKGKSADGMTALAFQLAHEATGNTRYRAAAIVLADRILRAMRATKHGVLFIKEKDRSDGESIDGGGPPAFGWYVAGAAYVLRNERTRGDDLRYLATVADNFPWHKDGWWANAVDIATLQPKDPLIKAGAINKNAGMALAAGVVAACVHEYDSGQAQRLTTKADACVYRQILPRQESDGFWHYGLSGNDPKGKDVLGYFMLTTEALLKLRHFAPAQRRPELEASLRQAGNFAATQIAPMTDPNRGPASQRTTPSTPSRFAVGKDPKRGFTLGLVLLGGGYQRGGMKIIDHWARIFPIGDKGQDGAKAADAFAHMLLLLPAPASQ